MQDSSISASAHLFFASATAFYLNEIGRLRAAGLEYSRFHLVYLKSLGFFLDIFGFLQSR